MTEFDGPWKEIFDEYLESFLALTFPHIHAQVDWSFPIDAKEQELRSIFPPSESTARVVDKLFRFIDWMMDLPPDLEVKFKQTLIEIEQETQMPYITSIERLAKAWILQSW